MCDVTLAVMAVGAVVSAYSVSQQAKAERRALEQNAAVDENNALQADWAATDAVRRGRTEESMSRLRTGQAFANQQVTLAANGVVTTEGSALALLSDTTMFGEIDAVTARNNAGREAAGFRSGAADLRYGSQLSRGRANAIRPGYSAVGSLIGSSSQFIGAYNRSQRRTPSTTRDINRVDY